MSDASDLIERMEKETGQRVDDDNSLAMAGLIGAMSRLMGQSPSTYRERDDVAAGLLIQHQMSPEGRREKERNELIANMLISGISPDDTKKLLG